MANILPEPGQVLEGVAIYLRHAYDSPLPSSVQSMLDSLQISKPDFFTSPPFTSSSDQDRQRYWLRLGNRKYPHMKLMLEPAPDGNGYLFRVDAHDLHVGPQPDHPEYPAFIELREQNRRLGERIENDWVAYGLPTFQAYLKNALARGEVSK